MANRKRSHESNQHTGVQNHQLCWLLPRLGGNNPSYPLCRDICYRSKNERGTRPNHLKKKSYERKEYSTLKREKHFLFDAFLDSYSVCKFIHLFPGVASIVGQQSSEDINQHWMDLLLSVCL
jgi:hypothetical protein